MVRLQSLLIALAAIAVTGGLTPSRAAPNGDESVAIGPWKIAADFHNSKFVDCVMSRTTADDVEVEIARDINGVSLKMASPKWRLGHGKSYPVDLVAGNLILKADVSANGDGVSVRLTDDEFIGKLAKANELDVRGAGSTITVALDQSAAGLDRLAACYDKNSKSSTEVNPFVAPKHKP